MPGSQHTSFLNSISGPEDLRKLRPEDLIQVSHELREFIIDVVSTNTGHLGASLGVIELTVALHYVFNTPHDRLIWDVGHQAYGHKILTGRRKQFHTNRKYQGLSGFPKRSESEYDAFGVGHSSTSISAALGMAVAASHKHENRQIIAVIGDGALTAGQAFEGLNNAGIEKTNLLVILNDNGIAIDPNVGALNEYLLDITTSRTYNRFKDEIWNMLGKLSKVAPGARSLVQQLEHGLKTTLLKQSNLFESLNFRYFGPVDGHDIMHLTQVLKDLQEIPGPKLLHCLTTKGKGFKQAELHQTAFHAPGKFDKITGQFLDLTADKALPPRFQDVFGHTLVELARKNDKIVGVTPAMLAGSSMNLAQEKFPDRVYDVGIAEQHAVTFSAGLAAEGMIPYCNIYSSFMQRAFDQVIHDVALQNLNVIFCLDRGGLVGSDGPTHHGAFDLAYMRTIPNMIVSAPMDEEELRNLMYTAQSHRHGPFSIRYPRGRGTKTDWKKPMSSIPVGKSRQLNKGTDLAILSIGHAGNFVKKATEKLAKEHVHVTHYDMRFLKPIDESVLHKVGKKFTQIITVEDGTIVGGLGSAVLEFFSDHGYHTQVNRLGIPDQFIEHGTQMELYKECGFDPDSIYKLVLQLIRSNILYHAG